MLHPEFREVGRSGREYTRETVITFISSQKAQLTVASDGFALAELGQDVALLTYRTAHVESDNGLVNHTFRSSVWVKATAGWQLRYHQGTPAAHVW